MKVVVITRDWRGAYDQNIIKARGMTLYGPETKIETGQDCYAMVFVDENTEIPAQELYDIWYDLQNEEEHEGWIVVDDDTIKTI